MGLFRYAPATASEAAAANSKRAISEHKVQYSYLNNQLIAWPIVSALVLKQPADRGANRICSD